MGGIFSSPAPAAAPPPPPPKPAPVIPEPTVIPTVDDKVARRVEKKSIARQKRRGGRQSTILSTSDKLGG